MQNITLRISLIIVSVLLLAAIAGCVWLYLYYVSPEEQAAVELADRLSAELTDAHAQLDASREELAARIAEAQSMQESLEEDIAERESKIDELSAKISVLLAEGTASDEYQQILLDEIASLTEQNKKSAAELEQLNILLAQYENITTLNFGYQAKKISDLFVLLTEPNRPIRTIVHEELDPETEEVVNSTTEERVMDLSFYYKDLASGYTLSYDSGEIRYTASLIKAPYIYSMLRTISEFEYQKLHFDAEGNPLYDEEGNPLFEGQHPNLDEEGKIIYLPGEEKYDLSRVWVYDAETMLEEGSGKICEMETGTEMSYLELVQYTLLHSDNIAFAQLRKMFGYTEYYAMARSLGVKGSSQGFMKLSADDCGIFMEAIHAFTEENETYGALMKNAMLESNYPVMITPGVYPSKCAHKYGWDEDSYHDMGIVYDEHPYILVIMTDYDDGGSVVNSYIWSVVRAVNSIHKTFYSTH